MTAFVKFEIQCKSPDWSHEWINTGYCEVYDIYNPASEDDWWLVVPQSLTFKLLNLKDAYCSNQYRILRTITYRDVIDP